MMKKLSLLTAAVAALVFAIPAVASASTGLTSPAGTLVPVGTVLVGTDTTTLTATGTGVGEITCNNVTLKGVVTKNGSTGVEVNAGGQTSTASTCFRNGTQAITVDGVTLEKLVSSSAETSTVKVTLSYVVHVGPLDCKFQITNATGTYSNNKDEVAITKQPQTVTPAACGAGGALDLTFTTETTAKAPILIMS